MKSGFSDNQNLNTSSEEKQSTSCQITVFILATLFISSLGSKGLCYGYLKNKKQIKLIYNPDENQDFFLTQ
ncbi:hypothetical protein C8C85_2202 [Flavobacterium sp. 103]|uniref:hypothetical protein n=1 Tax=Flavobacterium sp. 103 TaxID=2135624 RepID=UPI000D5D58B7|nr:hypothetical protein [Flavobacterium sp. 103]PVX46354.1 hypothetical protein C8C85_2202 [Flavobacterium sp. 103]